MAIFVTLSNAKSPFKRKNTKPVVNETNTRQENKSHGGGEVKKQKAVDGEATAIHNRK